MSQDRVFTVNIIKPDGKRIVFDDAVAVRIIDKFYNLLMMKDYMPIIGKVDGDLTVLGTKNSFSMQGGIAYFINHDNFFTVIIDSESANIPAEAQHAEGN